MSNRTDKEHVLYEFAAEPAHDRDTLERYLTRYPELTEDLIDLSAELRLNETLELKPAEALPDPGLQAAWKQFLGSRPAKPPDVQVVDLFAPYKGPAFVALAQALKVPRSILTAIRDGLVTPASVPAGFLRRFAQATAVPVESVRASLLGESRVHAALAFKSDTKPTQQTPITFRAFVLKTPMPDDQRALLLSECDEDERP